jgi:hypothetical protein
MIFQPEMLDTNKPMPEKMGRNKKTRQARAFAAGAPQPGRVEAVSRLEAAWGSRSTPDGIQAGADRHL